MSFNKKSLLNIGIGLLLLVMAFSVVFVRFGDGHLVSFGEVAIIMLIISSVMMIAPIMAWLINHKHLGRKRGIKICAVNSLLVFILASIWPVITIIKDKPCNPSNTICEVQFSWEVLGIMLLLATLYFLINICFCVDLHKTKEQH